MNSFYQKYKTTPTARTPVFRTICDFYLSRFANPVICEIGGMRIQKDPNSIHGDGWASFYWADHILKCGGGKLRIIDIDPEAIQSSKIMLDNFVKLGVDIEFICDDGMKYLGTKDHNLVYLDGPDNLSWNYEAYKKIPRIYSAILCDDANFNQNNPGKCLRIINDFRDYLLFSLENTTHEMIFYPLVELNEKSFKIGLTKLDYIRALHNNAYFNERSCEVSLGNYFYEKFFEEVSELGAVMPYYRETGFYEIIDPYDSLESCLKVDGLEYDYTGKNVLSISSIEHISNDLGYDKTVDLDKSIKVLDKIVKSAANYLITWPVGEHRGLDNYISKSGYPYTILKRKSFTSAVNNWFEDKNVENLKLPYGHFKSDKNFKGDPSINYYGNAICVVVVSNLPEIVNSAV